MTFNIWQPQGTVLANTAAFAPQQPNVIFEANAQILSGTVFKMWYTSSGGLNYAESTNGISWTEYTGNPIIAAPFWGTKIFKNSNTYFCFADQISVSTGLTNGAEIAVWTSSNGLSWTLENSAAIAPGSAGAWDSFGVAQLGIVGIFGGTWYGYYAGCNSSTKNYQVGLATSVDGIHWTKGANNPYTAFGSGVFKDGSSWTGSGNLTFAQRGGVLYGWSQTTPVAFPGSSSNLPTDITRWSAPHPLGPWTSLGSLTFYRTLLSEGVGNSNGQVADPSFVEADGNTYLFYTVTSDQVSSTFAINCAIAAMPLADLVKTYEGVQNVPIPYSLSLNLLALGNDNFQRANANPIGGSWTEVGNGLSNFTTSQIVSDTLQSSTLNDGSDSIYTAVSWPNDQYSEATVSAISISPSAIILDLRVTNPGTTPTFLRAIARIETGGTDGFIFQSFASGSGTNLQLSTFTPQVGDTYVFCVVGSTLYFYSNESLLFVETGVTPTAGQAGVGLAPATSISNAAISSWTGGGFQATPSPPFVSSGRGTHSK